HLHPQVCYHHVCDSSESNLRLGDWKGLALSTDGNLWVGGRWTGGQIRWTSDLRPWVNRPGNEIFSFAFGDPYKGPCGSASCNQPVFMVPAEGDVISVEAVAVATDGRGWFASGRTTGYDAPRGFSVRDGKSFRYYDPRHVVGMEESDGRDMVAMPSVRLVRPGNT